MKPIQLTDKDKFFLVQWKDNDMVKVEHNYIGSLEAYAVVEILMTKIITQDVSENRDRTLVEIKENAMDNLKKVVDHIFDLQKTPEEEADMEVENDCE